MASKRRQAAAAAAAAATTATVPGAESSSLKSPARRSRKRRGVAGPSGTTQDAESPCTRSKAKGEIPGEPPVSPRLPQETCVYKTPKRRLASRSCLPSFSSPANDNDMQQEIFWDPYSPIACQLDNGRRKHTVNGRMVEISEIVNRIAPQDDKPACYEGNLLGLWIGDDAIPCTPGITKTRSRTKGNGARGLQLRNREEELMKLAKQFDKNLTDAIQDQDASRHSIDHVEAETEMSIDHEDDAQEEHQEQFLGGCLQTNATMPCGVVEESSGRLGHCENSNQEPIDLDVEVALNELFDGPTQACSDSLSQGLSDCSSNSSFLENRNLLQQEQNASDEVISAAGAEMREAPQGQGSTAPLIECTTPISAEKAEATAEQAAPNVVSSKRLSNLERSVGDDFDDWGDDSFLMQITQNPELISTPENAFPCSSNDQAQIRERPGDSKKMAAIQGGLSTSSENVAATYILQKQSTGTGKTYGVHLEFEKAISKHSPNKISGNSSGLVQPKSKSVQQDFTRLKCPADSSSSEKRAVPSSVNPPLPKTQVEKYGSSTAHMDCQLPTVSATTMLPELRSTTDPGSTGCLKPKEPLKKSVLLFNDWDEPKFSDEVLDFYWESDSLWGTSCDDDDLLYQVCDDVERNTLTQLAVEKGEQGKSVVEPPCRLAPGPCSTVPNPGLTDCPEAQRTRQGRKTFCLDAPATVATMLKKERSVPPAAKELSTGESVRSFPEKWCRSLSVPKEDLSSRIGSPILSSGHLSINDVKQQNGLCNMGKVQNGCLIPQMAAVKPNYVFRKTGPSQPLALDHENNRLGRLPGTHMGLLESKNANVPLQTTVQANGKLAFRRHLSDSFAQSETEQRSRKCSQEEIARKKQEALERRRWKMEALLKSTAPT
ncbi:hypothetical protein JRQ81_003944 [Phrynocephalus forsythii]|uniref:Ewing's tumor-associated antigen 1 n=1 Tax=Phrynocephalus forsythii TaxID=171643 RepID=A0A9Q0XL64_9SAUR|nr:hypothetical protein JRQ81_003944 [Phrynocephalus forsythii]